MLSGNPKSSQGSPLVELREQAIADLDAVIEAAAAASAVLPSYHSALETCRKHLSSGGRPSDMRALLDIAATRATVSDQLKRVVEARSESRLSLWRLLYADGMSITDIANTWGLSRQLVSRELSSENPPG